MSQAMSCASARTLARRCGSVGSSGGCGWVSSRYSMIASDWVSISPVVELERRHAHLRIDRPIVRLEILPAVFLQVDRNGLEGEVLEIERDAHAIGGGRAEIRIKLHRIPPSHRGEVGDRPTADVQARHGGFDVPISQRRCAGTPASNADCVRLAFALGDQFGGTLRQQRTARSKAARSAAVTTSDSFSVNSRARGASSS